MKRYRGRGPGRGGAAVDLSPVSSLAFAAVGANLGDMISGGRREGRLWGAVLGMFAGAVVEGLNSRAEDAVALAIWEGEGGAQGGEASK